MQGGDGAGPEGPCKAFAGGRWEPKGLGAEEGWELIQVLTGALLPLWRGTDCVEQRAELGNQDRGDGSRWVLMGARQDGKGIWRET